MMTNDDDRDTGSRYLPIEVDRRLQLATPVARDNRSLLINQPMFSAEITSARSSALEQQITSILSRKNYYEQWLREAWSKTGASFLISPPDSMGYIRDEEFMVDSSKRKDRGQQLDPHRANLASVSLPGGGLRTIHNNKEADPWMTHYIDHISSSHTSARNSPHAIVPDILAHQYPAGRQRINDGGASFCQDETKPADRRAKEVIIQYSNKFKKLDKQYTADIVGNGDNEEIVGPFESAQKRPIGGQVIPLVVRPFEEVNKDFEKVLKTLSRLAAAGEDGMSISPLLLNTDRKGGAFIIMLQQFMRALGVMVVGGMANCKLSRLRYVQTTAEKAKFTA
eukprot:scaffold19546_cov65-Cyclotella_meneghiniana.AAC.5